MLEIDPIFAIANRKQGKRTICYGTAKMESSQHGESDSIHGKQNYTQTKYSCFS